MWSMTIPTATTITTIIITTKKQPWFPRAVLLLVGADIIRPPVASIREFVHKADHTDTVPRQHLSEKIKKRFFARQIFRLSELLASNKNPIEQFAEDRLSVDLCVCAHRKHKYLPGVFAFSHRYWFGCSNRKFPEFQKQVLTDSFAPGLQVAGCFDFDSNTICGKQIVFIPRYSFIAVDT